MSFLWMVIRLSLVIFILAPSFLHSKKSSKTSHQSLLQNQLLATRYIKKILFSPDKKHLLFVYAHPQIKKDSRGSVSQWVETPQIEVNYGTQKGRTKKFSSFGKFSSLIWTPNSAGLSYLSPGDNFTSLWFSPIGKGKPLKLFEFTNNIIDYQWSPDGRKLVILLDSSSATNSLKIVHDSNNIKNYKIYVCDVTENMDIKSPVVISPYKVVFKTEPSGTINWTPDSQSLVVSHVISSEESSDQLSQISLVSLKTRQNQPLIKGKGVYLNPFVSPNGQFVAYITNALPENTQSPVQVHGMDASRVCITNLESLKTKCLAKTPNENPTLVGWTKGSQSLLVVDREGNGDQIYEIGIDGSTLRTLTEGEHSLTSVSLTPSLDKITYAATTLKTPFEGFITPIDQYKPERITASHPLSYKNDFIVEKVNWKSGDGKYDLEGLFLYPKTTLKEKTLPLLTILHDYGSPFFPLGYVGTLNMIPLSYGALLDKGYALFIPNRRGSNGYGVQFRQAIFRELGAGDYGDVMSGVDHIIEQKNVDPHKLALWGWGYGGYVAAWVLTQTDRFKAIVVGAGISNLISHLGTTTKDQLIEPLMGGPFWEDWNFWREKTPLMHIKKANTPTLIQQGDMDATVDLFQSQELYFPLKTRHVPVQMITYETQDHEFFNPHLALLAIQDLQTWLEKYLGTSPKVSKDKKESANAP